MIEEAPSDEQDNEEEGIPDFDLYMGLLDEEDSLGLNEDIPLVDQFVEEGYMTIDDPFIWLDDAMLSILENVKSFPTSLGQNSTWDPSIDNNLYSGSYEVLFMLTFLSFLVAFTFRKTVGYFRNSAKSMPFIDEAKIPVQVDEKATPEATFISCVNVSDFESFGPVIPKTDYEAPEIHCLEEEMVTDDRSQGSILDELIHRRQMIETVSPSASSLTLSQNLNNDLISLYSNESPIELTVLSDELTNGLVEGEHDSQLFDLSDGLKNYNEFMDLSIAGTEQDLQDLQVNRTENTLRSSKEILEETVRETERILKLTDMADRLASLVSQNSNGLEEIIDYFEKLSENETLSGNTGSASTHMEQEENNEIRSLKQITNTTTTSPAENVDPNVEGSSSESTDKVLQQIELPNNIITNEIPRKQSILKAVFNNSPTKNQVHNKFGDSKIPVPTSSEKHIGRILHSPRPKSQKLKSFTISKPVLEYLLERPEPDLDEYLTSLFDADPKIVINSGLLESLSKENIDTLLGVYKGKETSENWKERYDNFDILIGHLRLHLPQSLYTYFEEKIYDNMEDILAMVSTTRSKLLEKVILFFREIVYYGNNYTLTDEFFVVLLHLLIPLTKSTSKFIHKLSLKSLCLMVQAVDITTFRRCFDLMFLDILSNKKLKGEKFACLFMIKFYVAANYNLLKDEDTEDIIGKLAPLVSSLAIDSFQLTRAELVEIYLILEKRIPESTVLVKFYEGFSNFLKTRVKKPDALINTSPDVSGLLESF